ncbi:hypothetical protein V6N13_099266 [Hibiscus sabdariffa]|uniref:Carbohydrate kinase PfkB domain-containing protein n=1 Tax=Hibiscus sabdariffa TaxID=183260 RepID=A0ABR2PZ59_9ROSI
MKIEPFGTNQIDPTDAGDSFLSGFVGGLVVPDVALVGNLFGSLTVGQIGFPKFDLRLLQVESNLVANIHGHTESFLKELNSVKNLWKNRSELKIEEASIDALFESD